jgi:hypothetical protein
MNVGQRVAVVIPGVLEGATGKIVRISEGAPFLFITLDRYKSDPTYRNHEFGPFSTSELQVQE